jgi:isoleucyl-tRNA synthetase
VSHAGGESIALDLEVTAPLRRLGLARDVVRLVQDARKAAGLEVSDRISLRWQAEGELAEALREHGHSVAEEVLAPEFLEGLADGGGPVLHDPDTGLRFSLRPVVPTP